MPYKEKMDTITTRKKVIVVIVASLCVLTMGGVVFGFSSLYELLYREGVYACDDGDCPPHKACCSEQRLKLSLMASCSLFAADGVMVLYGELNDRLGPRACLAVGTILGAIGFSSMAWRWWFFSLVSLGISGPGVFMGCMGFGSIGDLEPIITAACAAMWDSSSIVFLLFSLLTRKFTVVFVLGAWSIFSFVLGASALSLLPRSESVKEKRENVLPFLFRRDTALLLAFMAFYNLKSAFYIETISDQIRQTFSERDSEDLDLAFDVAFPVGGFLTTFLAAPLLTRPRFFYLVLVFAMAFSLIQLSPTLYAQYAAACLFGPARTLLWSLYFHLLFVRYPHSVSGRLIGYGNLFIAVIGDGIPYALVAYIDTNSTTLSTTNKYVAIHAILAGLVSIFGVLFFSHIAREKSEEYSAPLISAEP